MCSIDIYISYLSLIPGNFLPLSAVIEPLAFHNLPQQLAKSMTAHFLEQKRSDGQSESAPSLFAAASGRKVFFSHSSPSSSALVGIDEALKSDAGPILVVPDFDNETRPKRGDWQSDEGRRTIDSVDAKRVQEGQRNDIYDYFSKAARLNSGSIIGPEDAKKAVGVS